MSVVGKTLQRARNFVPVGGCDGSPRSTRVTGSQLCWLVLLMLVIAMRCPSLSGQTPPSANLQVGHESWTFNDGAPPDVDCLAQTNDGFLWLCAPSGLVRFDGTRFEPFKSPFGDHLLSNNVHSLFAPRSGGLWVGYLLGGFSFLNNGRITNYAGETGSISGFAQDRDGILWARASSGLWRFDHSSWQHLGVEWDVPAGDVRGFGFDSQGTLWVLVGNLGAPKDLIYLMPGTRRFKTAKRNLSVEGFTHDADRFVVTDPVVSPMPNSGEGSDERQPVYPVLEQENQVVDRNNGLWTSPPGKPVLMRLPRESLHHAFDKVPPAASETYDMSPFVNAELVDREGNIWFGDSKGLHRFFYTPLIRQELPKEAFNRSDFAVLADDNGAVWISLTVVVKGRARELYATVLEGAFSIGREALINALHHSGGLHVEVEIAYHPEQFRLRVRDDGRGIDPEVLQQGGRPDHWGLQGMRERAQTMDAQLQLWSRPEAGTEVELKVPGTTAYRSVSG